MRHQDGSNETKTAKLGLARAEIKKNYVPDFQCSKIKHVTLDLV